MLCFLANGLPSYKLTCSDYLINTRSIGITLPFFFIFTSYIVRSYQHHLEVTNSIWGDDWSHSFQVSPRWVTPGFSSAVRYTAPIFISVSPLSLSEFSSECSLKVSQRYEKCLRVSSCVKGKFPSTTPSGREWATP
jgi:hypothetical protein